MFLHTPGKHSSMYRKNTDSAAAPNQQFTRHHWELEVQSKLEFNLLLIQSKSEH